MYKIVLFLCGLMILSSGCTHAVPNEAAVTVVNTGAVSPELQERVRAFAEKELHVRVRSRSLPALAEPTDFEALATAALAARDDADVALIVLSELDEADHLRANAEICMGMVNVKPLHTNDAELFARRIERMVMRAAAFSFGLEPTPDPYCVTRDYRSLEDLDRMGRNFSPPWQGRYATEAAKRGLFPPQLKPAGLPSEKQ